MILELLYGCLWMARVSCPILDTSSGQHDLMANGLYDTWRSRIVMWWWEPNTSLLQMSPNHHLSLDHQLAWRSIQDRMWNCCHSKQQQVKYIDFNYFVTHLESYIWGWPLTYFHVSHHLQHDVCMQAERLETCDMLLYSYIF